MGGIHVYTGKGKGKTTASVGLAIRARSRGMRVLFVQFMKRANGGETELLEKLGIAVHRFEEVLSPHFHPEADKQSIRSAAEKAVVALKPMLRDFDLVVVDEFNHLLANDFLTKEEAMDLIGSRPEAAVLVLTGRGAPDWLIDLADDVTEMKEIKHSAKKGTKARKGIEY